MRGRGFILAVILMSVPAVLLVMASLLGLMRAEATLSEWRQTQLQSLYLAQAGESVALLGLTRCNFSRATHLADGASVGPAERLGLDYPGLVVAPDGWYVWEGRGLGQEGVDQSFRLQVVFPTAGEWLITVEGAHGAGHRTLRVRGRLEGVFGYALFDAGDLSEFVRGADQTVTGAVHANGNLFLRPTSSTLTLLSDAVTSAGNIIRSRDAWGRADEGGTVRISVGTSTGALATMAGGANGTAFDSQHANWATALTRWQGVVKDTALGAATRTPLGIESIQPGGYYDQHADRRVDGNTTTAWCHSRTFYNQAEGRSVQVQEIDLAALSAAGQYPANGLLYSSVPVRLVNGTRLAGPLTVVSAGTVYTRGDFNKTWPTEADLLAGTSQKVPAALITCDRIYHLSSSFDDSASGGSPIPLAREDPLYPGDAGARLEVNAALVDGPPTVDERNWQVGTSWYDPVHRPGQNAWANSDDFLEDWRGLVVQKRGSNVHLENAVMAALDNSGAGTPWIVKTHYQAPVRDYGADASLQTSPPPFTPFVSRLVRWEIAP